MKQFSQILLDRMILHFQEVHGVELSPEEAYMYLASFADLYICMSKGLDRRRKPVSPADAGKRGAPDPPSR